MMKVQGSVFLYWVCLLMAWMSVGLLHAEPVQHNRGKAGYRCYNIDFESQFGRTKNRDIYVWYPTSDTPKEVGEGWKKGFVAINGRVSPGKHPLVLFSHGYRASGHQVVYLMETLARAGYIVVTTDHSDSFHLMLRERGAWLPLLFGGNLWKNIGVQSRREDIMAMLESVLDLNEENRAFLNGRIDETRIGIIGYSLGGYTSLAMLGAVPAWKDERLKAGLLLAPFFPWSGTELKEIEVPTMVQAGSWDLFVTPKVSALYRSLPSPSQLLVFKQATHFTWTNFASLGKDTVAVVQEEGNPRLIVEYTGAFFDETLKGMRPGHSNGRERKKAPGDVSILRKPNKKLKKYLWK